MNDKKHFEAGLVKLGITLSAEQQAQLAAYVDLLLAWNKRLNLIAPSTEMQVWTRHILDSLVLRPYIDKADRVLDVGSGGGLPAIPLAICSGAHITACERIVKKANFLKHVRRELALAEVLTVVADDVQNVPPAASGGDSSVSGYAAVTARAVAKVQPLVELCEPFLAENGRFLLLKGSNVAQEVDVTHKNLRMTYDIFPSKLDDSGQVVKITRST